MAALDFPNSPSVGQQYPAPNGATYQWDGAAWVVTGGPPAVPTGPAGGDLAGAYPNPTVTPAAKSKWQLVGSTLTPVDATKSIALVPSGHFNPLAFGARTIKGRLLSAISDEHLLTCNAALNAAGSAFVQDDATKASWLVDLNVTNDAVNFYRLAAGGALTTPFSLDATGNPLFGGTLLKMAGLPVSGGSGVEASGSYSALLHNYGSLGGNTGKAGWGFFVRSDLDYLHVDRKPSGAGAAQRMLTLDGPTAKLTATLADGIVQRNMITAGHSLWTAVAVNVPASFSTTAAAWTTVASLTVGVRASGCFVLLLSTAVLKYTGSASANTVYLAWLRDGGLLFQSRCDFSGAVSGFWTWPIPTLCSYDNSSGAGNHTYALAVYVANTNGSVTTPGDSTGQISAWSFS